MLTEGGSRSAYAGINMVLLTDADPPTADGWYSCLFVPSLYEMTMRKNLIRTLTDGPLNRVCRYDILRPCLFPSGRQAALMPRQLTPSRLFADSQFDSFA